MRSSVVRMLTTSRVLRQSLDLPARCWERLRQEMGILESSAHEAVGLTKGVRKEKGSKDEP